MKQIPFTALACPLDGLPLQPAGNSMKCANHHNFDFDRKGTLNLLPVQFRKSKNPGDSSDMVAARSRFLEAGFYQAISDKLNDLCATLAKDHLAILDAGCGEGYYTYRLAEFLNSLDRNNNFSLLGLDISKPAIAAASRRDKNISWIVATNAKIPVIDHSIDILLCLFGFPVWAEFHRILKPGGSLILVEPGPDHLIELRRQLYPEIKEKITAPLTTPGFICQSHEPLHRLITPPSPDLLHDQIMMTPHGFRATTDRIHAAVNHGYETMTLDVFFSVYGATLPA